MTSIGRAIVTAAIFAMPPSFIWWCLDPAIHARRATGASPAPRTGKKVGR